MYKPSEQVLPWKLLSTYVCHAIYPKILDDFWTESVREGKCSGALIKRWDSAPAGFAAPAVLQAGVSDLVVVAPGIVNVLKDEVQYIKTLNDEGLKHRFAGSVNARYYGADRIRIDEKRLAAIAAVIRASIDQLAPDAPLGKSPALKRIANQAPVTGNVIAR